MVIETSELMGWDISDLRIHTGKKVMVPKSIIVNIEVLSVC